MKTGPKTRKMWERARQTMPLGVNSNFRYWGDDMTFVIKRGEGAYVWDMDANRYIDYRLAWGPVILGHAYPSVVERVSDVLKDGNVFAMSNEIEIRVAEKICAMTGMDMVRLTNTGTEATMHAIRFARAYTGRDKILKFEGHYHGFQDYTLFNCQPPIPGIGYRRSPVIVPHGSGTPRIISQLVECVPFNDFELLEKVVKDNWQHLACIILEPIMGNSPGLFPKPGYLELIRKLCDEHGIVMIMDEVKTGFRVANGGAQELFGVKGDLATYAKALGNGFPIAAIAGCRKIMGEIDYQKIPHGGTYSGNAVSVAAAEAVLDELEAGILKKVHAHGKKLIAGIREIISRKGIPALVQGSPGMFGIVFTELPKVFEYREWSSSNHGLYSEILLRMMEKGVMPDMDSREPWFISASHSDADAGVALQAFEDALTEVMDKPKG
jgi:glutamate-1-semialdehyde 2,1-aminomutase